MVSNDFRDNDKYRKKLAEQYDDSFLQLVVYDYAEKEGEELLREADEAKNDPQYYPSAKLVKSFCNMRDGFFKKQKMVSFVKKSQKILSKVGIFVVAFAAVFALAFSTVSAFRTQVLNMLLTFDEKYTSVKVDENSSVPLHNIYAPSYIPDGYRLNDFSTSKDLTTMEYINNNEKTINFIMFNSSGDSNIDTENADSVKSIKINGTDGMIVEKKGIITVSWANENKAFIVSAQLGESEIVKIAENIIFIK